MLPMTALAARETYTIRFWMVDKQNSNAAAGKTVGMTSAFTVPAPFDTYIEEMAAGGKVFRHWTSEKDGSGKTYAAGTLASKLTTRVGDRSTCMRNGRRAFASRSMQTAVRARWRIRLLKTHRARF